MEQALQILGLERGPEGFGGGFGLACGDGAARPAGFDVAASPVGER